MPFDPSITTASPSRQSRERRARAGAVRRRWTLSPAGGGHAALVVRGAHPADARLLEALRRHRLSPEVVRLDQGEALPDVHTLRLALVSGSGAPEEHVTDWLRDADGAGVPVLALGTAAHELTLALGGSVAAAPHPRRAWIHVASREPRLVAAGPWLTWDGGSIELPPIGRELAGDHTGPQAFAAGSHVGIQLHPYAAAATVRDWAARSEVVIDTQGLLEGASRDYAASVRAADQLVDGFLTSRLAELRKAA